MQTNIYLDIVKLFVPSLGGTGPGGGAVSPGESKVAINCTKKTFLLNEFDADVLFMCSFFLTNINPDSIPCFGYRGVGMELDK